MKPKLPDVHFKNASHVNWRDPKYNEHGHEHENEHRPTDNDVREMLGFDPQHHELFKHTSAAKAKPLYVFRPVLNAKNILDWYKLQKCEQLYHAKDLHITICFSKKPVVWSDIERKKNNVVIDNTSYRKMAKLGNAVVLKIKSNDLQKQHERFIDAGASWDFPTYKPHVSIIDDDHNTVDVKAIKPFLGKIVLGPEEFETLDLDK